MSQYITGVKCTAMDFLFLNYTLNILFGVGLYLSEEKGNVRALYTDSTVTVKNIKYIFILLYSFTKNYNVFS